MKSDHLNKKTKKAHPKTTCKSSARAKYKKNRTDNIILFLTVTPITTVTIITFTLIINITPIITVTLMITVKLIIMGTK